MKRFLLLSFVSLTTAHAACDYEIRDRMYRTAEQQREYRCDQNFKCAEAAIKNPDSDPSELETLGDYARENKCNDELKLAALFESLMEEELGEDPSIDNSDRGNSKSDLPIIPDAPSDSGSKVHRQ